MASIDEIALTISWITTYPAVLTGGGKLTSRADHAAAVYGDAALAWPWRTDDQVQHWSRFWSSYLRKTSRIRTINADSAWSQLVPFQSWPVVSLRSPGVTSAEARVLIYPHAIAVSISVLASGSWAVNDLATEVAELRTSRAWGPSADRSLDGLATDMRSLASVRHLAEEPGDPGQTTVYTVAAPLRASGREFGLTQADVRATLAGLASAGPPGEFDEARLLASNSDSSLAARVYLSRRGHAIWHPERMLAADPGASLKCLVGNQTDLVVHIAALDGAITWAEEQISAGAQIPLAVQPLARRAAERVLSLHEGDPRKTYRSGVARVRTEPLLPAARAVVAAL
ncbi:hypothetical protein [Lentzea sp. NPDC055074]